MLINFSIIWGETPHQNIVAAYGFKFLNIWVNGLILI